ncbi:MAG: type II CRISPR RNA-guided endonuclease Cas9 [Tannerellaceae bacterium]|nr:type II CRISPR RNA-guided endonuclease Cas9 [Tannerellaceae bacterium]
MKNIVGLDLGTNSIGWAIVSADGKGNPEKVVKAGVRIIPMSQDILGKFNNGNSISQTAERTGYRGTRHLRERHLLRRERLHRVLHLLGFLPVHYDQSIGWNKEEPAMYGKFLPETEPKLAWDTDEKGRKQFLFTDSYREMLEEFRKSQPGISHVPYDWTIYYLRKKALTVPLSPQELAWLILHFNRKRGYYQLRGEEEENKGKTEEYHSLKVVEVEKEEQSGKGGSEWYAIRLENGWVYRRSSKIPLFDWVGTTRDFIVTTDLDADGQPKTDKEGVVKRSFRAPKEDDWALVKKKTETELMLSGKTVGEYIFDTLLSTPYRKVRGQLIRTIERRFYKEELKQILYKQQQFLPVLTDREIFTCCVAELYPNNLPHQQNVLTKDLCHLIVEDILFYQRPLKSQKHLIANCPYEYYTYRKQGVRQMDPLKCIPRSHPLFQEFRVRQFMQNLRIYKREEVINGKLQTDVDQTDRFIGPEKKEALFEYLMNKGEIKQEILLKEFFRLKKPDERALYRWNYVEDKSYPCNDTRAMLVSKLKKSGIEETFLTAETEFYLWHLLYSVEDRYELEKALTRFALQHELPENFTEVFRNCPPFKKEYGAYSAKAIKKLLALMRFGKDWKKEEMDAKTAGRIEKLLTGEEDPTLRDLVRDKVYSFESIEDFQDMPLYLACYIVYGRHSESGQVVKWNSPGEMEHYMQSEFKQHSLHNPIVEQVVRETMRTVQDIWKTYGHIDEIHLELGREMKNPADKRAAITQMVTENENRNLRIKALLMELKGDASIENVRPFSPGQQEILKIYEEGALASVPDLPEDIARISRMQQPSASELVRYKLWLEQRYCSPYTGRPIPLSKLFTPAYEIEHVIPQSRYFDDSLSNKVICESEVNKLKGNQLGYEFIKKHGGQIIESSFGKPVRIFTTDEYQQFVQAGYRSNRAKMKKLLLEEIPEAFIQRQLNDSRYIAKVVKGLLSNIVREKEEAGFDSKHVIVCSGSVTSRLKQDWGLTDVWDRIIRPRFERLNEITQSTEYGGWEENRFRIRVPYTYQKGFNKKRIDHRHHALDAIIIACATRNHVNYLSNAYAGDTNKRYDLRNQLCRTEEVEYTVVKNGETVKNKARVAREFLKPWETFTPDIQTLLEQLVVSFKQNVRVLGRSANYTQYYDAEGKKRYKKQVKGDLRSIRKPLHKDTVSGQVTLREQKNVRLAVALQTPGQIVDKHLRTKIRELSRRYGGYNEKLILAYFKDRAYKWEDQDVSKVAVYYLDDQYAATRKTVDSSFNQKTIDSITDTGIRKILTNHLARKGNNPEVAFSPEGIAEMNATIRELNDAKFHQPIQKVRVYEPLGSKFAVGYTGNKKKKYVEAAKGTNLFFAVYQSANGKRTYESVPLNIVIERLKQGDTPVPAIRTHKGVEETLLFWLSPNDLVYVPTEEEQANPHLVDFQQLTKEQVERIYKMVSCTGAECFFLQGQVAVSIRDKFEYSSLNKMARSTTGEMIKDVCWKLKVDRLGNITAVTR